MKEQLKKLIPNLKWTKHSNSCIGCNIDTNYSILVNKGYSQYSVRDSRVGVNIIDVYGDEAVSIVELAYKIYYGTDNISIEKSKEEFLKIISK